MPHLVDGVRQIGEMSGFGETNHAVAGWNPPVALMILKVDLGVAPGVVESGRQVRGNGGETPPVKPVFDPNLEWTYWAADSRSKSRNTPFDGWKLKGAVTATIVGGRVVYRRDKPRLER